LHGGEESGECFFYGLLIGGSGCVHFAELFYCFACCGCQYADLAKISFLVEARRRQRLVRCAKSVELAAPCLVAVDAGSAVVPVAAVVGAAQFRVFT